MQPMIKGTENEALLKLKHFRLLDVQCRPKAANLPTSFAAITEQNMNGFLSWCQEERKGKRKGQGKEREGKKGNMKKKGRGKIKKKKEGGKDSLDRRCTVGILNYFRPWTSH